MKHQFIRGRSHVELRISWLCGTPRSWRQRCQRSLRWRNVWRRCADRGQGGVKGSCPWLSQMTLAELCRAVAMCTTIYYLFLHGWGGWGFDPEANEGLFLFMVMNDPHESNGHLWLPPFIITHCHQRVLTIMDYHEPSWTTNWRMNEWGHWSFRTRTVKLHMSWWSVYTLCTLCTFSICNIKWPWQPLISMLIVRYKSHDCN